MGYAEGQLIMLDGWLGRGHSYVGWRWFMLSAHCLHLPRTSRLSTLHCSGSICPVVCTLAILRARRFQLDQRLQSSYLPGPSRTRPTSPRLLSPGIPVLRSDTKAQDCLRRNHQFSRHEHRRLATLQGLCPADPRLET